MNARALALALAALGIAGAASAHDTGLSQSDFTVEGDAVRAHLVLAAPDLEALLDADHDGRVTLAEVDGGRAGLASLVRDTEVTAGGAPCPGALEGVSVEGVDGVAIDARFACPAGATGELAVTLHWLGARPPGHRHVARLVSGKRTMSAVLDAQRQGTSIAMDAPRAPTAPKEEPAPRAWWIALALAATIGALAWWKLRYNRRP